MNFTATNFSKTQIFFFIYTFPSFLVTIHLNNKNPRNKNKQLIHTRHNMYQK